MDLFMFLGFPLIHFSEVSLIYRVVLISEVQQGDPVRRRHSFPFSYITGPACLSLPYMLVNSPGLLEVALACRRFSEPILKFSAEPVPQECAPLVPGVQREQKLLVNNHKAATQCIRRFQAPVRLTRRTSHECPVTLAPAG